jgi:chromosome segregation ATPase
VSESAANHLRTELATSTRTIAEREADLARMDDHYKRKQAGLSSMEKDLVDKDKEIGRLNREAAEMRKRKPEVQYVEKPTAPAGYTSIAESIQRSNDELAEIEKQIAVERAALASLETERRTQTAAIDAERKVQASLQDVSVSFEVFAAKLTGAQLAMQACETPAQHAPLLEALGAMLRKTVSELDAALGR